ncbi:AMP-binding protein [Skermania sp. ID1734]|nr:AMP-binding protein [Skermania sp. ID1734]
MTPLRFLERAAEVHPDKTAVVDGDRRITYAELAAHVTRLAHALGASGVEVGDRIAYLTSNSFEMLVAHFAVPLAGGVLVAINTRLSVEEVTYICDHSGAVLLVGDAALLEPVRAATFATIREFVETPGVDGDYAGIALPYAELVARGSDAPIPWSVDDEDAVISINYTSGTTGRPKGVMYTHRGAYLASLGAIHHEGFDIETRYLWTLPMFHCNGWCTTWAVTAVAGTHVCLRAVRDDVMWELIDNEGIDHLNGAPTVLVTLATSARAHPLKRSLTATTAGAPPSPTVIAAVRGLGFTLNHVYGLTETYGPYSVCEPGTDWDTLPGDELSRKLARQGVGMLTADRMRVVRTERAADGSLIDVQPDGVEMGEIVMRGNMVMKGYFNDPERTAEAFAGGWFHSGDLGVMHPDGYVQLLDRAKDIIISGGENISTVEVEQALASHPAVREVAVIGVPDDKWGERPKAFVVLVPGTTTTPDELTTHTKAQIASYKAPRSVEFLDELPKTSTGKVRKKELRDAEWGHAVVRIQG